MKIGLFTDPASNSKTGPGKVMYELFKNIIELNERHDLVIVRTEEGPEELYSPDVKEITISSNPLIGAIQLRKYNLDLIHMHSISTKENYFYPFLSGAKIISHQHGDLHFLSPDIWVHSRTRKIRKILSQFVLSRFLDKIIAVSFSSKKVLSSSGIPSRKIEVVYNAVSDKYSPTEEEPSDYILHVSNRTSKKNPGILLSAFENIVEKGYDIRLKIVGSKWKNYLGFEEISNKTRERIDVLGRVPEEELRELYKNAILYFAPTLHETFGMTTLEAMSSGTPVVSSNVYSVPEIVGDAGILIDNPRNKEGFVEAIERLLDNPKERDILAEKGLEQSNKFSWEKSARKVLKIYEDISS